MAVKYNVSVVSIECIVKNKYYYDPNYTYIYIKTKRKRNKNSKLNFEIIKNICNDYKIIKSYEKLSKKYNVSPSTIKKAIKNNVCDENE